MKIHSVLSLREISRYRTPAAIGTIGRTRENGSAEYRIPAQPWLIKLVSFQSFKLISDIVNFRAMNIIIPSSSVPRPSLMMVFMAAFVNAPDNDAR